MSHQITPLLPFVENQRMRLLQPTGNANSAALTSPTTRSQDGGFSPSSELQASQEEVTALAGLLVGLLAAYGELMESNNTQPTGRATNKAAPSTVSTPSSGSGGGAIRNGNGSSPTATASSGGAKPTNSSGSASKVGPKTGRVVDVPGGKVDASIADNVKKMLNDAKKDGVDLQISSSFRSREEQEKLYQSYLNGTGNLAAKPGSSNHESGLAIDFKNTSGAYDWLKKNAGRYGLKNLPSEPWHYSTNGK
jgi:D-alanyl-D-alanine carboxypeptidase-like protein